MKKNEKIYWLFVIILACILAMEIIILATAKADTAFVCMVHKGEWLWIREAPSKDAKAIDQIRYGVEGEIHEIRNGYARVTTENGKTGWADVSYLEMPIKEKVYLVACESPLNKRETPDGRYLTKIKSGTRISVLGWRYSKKGELWAKVYKGGYVKAAFLEEVVP